MITTMTDKQPVILIVDDEEPLRRALGDKFEHAGFRVLPAENGKQALQLATAEHPDLVLLDIVMPRLDGIAVLKQLRADEQTKHIPIILLTNLADNYKLMEATAAGVFDYLIKSDWKLEDVVKKVKEKLHLD